MEESTMGNRLRLKGLLSDRVTYLASPYTHSEPEIQEQRFKLACSAVSAMTNAGRRTFSPVVHNHPVSVSHSEIANDFAFWKPFCEAMLYRSNRLAVLLIDGWQESVGVRAEFDLAVSIGLPIDLIKQCELGCNDWSITEDWKGSLEIFDATLLWTCLKGCGGNSYASFF
jgi:hypothetical protein